MSKSEKVRSVEKIAKHDTPCMAICAGKHCAKAGTKHILRAVREALEAEGATESISVELTKCQDYCDDAPVLTVLPGEYVYPELTPQTARLVVHEHVRNGRPALPLLHKRMRKRLQKREERAVA